MKMKFILIFTLSIATARCGQPSYFGSSSPLTTGVIGKFWGETSLLDSSIYGTDDPGTTLAALVRDFDVAVSGSTLQIMGSLLNPVSEKYTAYAAIFGSDLTSIASVAATDAGAVSVGANPYGLFVAQAFFGTTSINTRWTGSAWQNYTSKTSLSQSPDTLTDATEIAFPTTATVFDQYARGTLFFVYKNIANDQLYSQNWNFSTSTGTVDPIRVSTDTLASRHFSAVFDGVNQVCASNATLTEIKVRCATAGATAADLTSPTTTTTTTAATTDHQMVTDGSGGLMLVYTKSSDATVYTALRSAAGAWTSSSFSTTATPYKIGVTHVGSGNYLAVWIEQNTTAQTTAVYSSLYTAGVGWSDPVAVTDSDDTYTSIPHPQSLDVFSNGNGNAGFALNTLYVDTSAKMYEAPNGTRRIWTARWQSTSGWLPVNDIVDLCYSDYTIPAGYTADGSCKHVPRGVILPSGDTAVFFQTLDDYGYRRLGVVEFK